MRGAWTDSNSHDPGVTLLEVLTYSLSDLAADMSRRFRAGKCGWRCALVIAVGAASAVLLIQYPKVKSRS
ncbi:MAG: hypothetical protein M3O61_02435 [Gemmatimonadota bacterium]|nr:hypothetical protein [Gemmatimonadota bacterium]